MKLDYSKTLNEQQDTIENILNENKHYSLQLQQLQQEKEELINWLKTEYMCFDNESDECIIARQILSKLKGE